MRTGAAVGVAVVTALLLAHGAAGHHDPRPDPLRGQSHVGHYSYLLETLEIRRNTTMNRPVLPDVPHNVLIDVKVRVWSHDNQHSFFVFNYGVGDYQKFSFGEPIYQHEDCTPDERPVYFYARAVLLPRDFQLPAGLRQGALISKTNEESRVVGAELDKLLSDKQAIPLGLIDYKIDPDVHHDELGGGRNGWHVTYKVRPSYIVDGTLCSAKKMTPGACTITGSGVIKGTPGNDVICGGPGNDTCIGGGGNDMCKLGGGNNTCIFGPGNDTCITGDGNDICIGGGGNDVCKLGGGNNKCDLGPGNDTCVTGSGNDICKGGPGNDKCFVGDGNNTCDLGPGNDICRAGSGNDTCDGGPGRDICELDGGTNTCKGIGPGETCHGATETPPPPPGKYTCVGDNTLIQNNFNIYGVENGGSPPTFSTGTKAFCLTMIATYHWNGGKGATPGTLGLVGGGKTIGPWQAVGQAPDGSPGNIAWIATPPAGQQVILSGSYSCKDSSPATWSQNKESSGEGFCRVWAQEAQKTG